MPARRHHSRLRNFLITWPIAVMARGRATNLFANVVGVDHVGGKESDDCPVDNAVSEVDRQGHLEITDDDYGPVPWRK